MKLVPIAHLTLLVGFHILVLTACNNRPQSSAGVVSEPKALELAKLEFAKQGHKLEGYVARVQSDDPQEKHWIVWFEQKGTNLLPNGSDAVLVNKVTGKVSFVQGE